MRVPAGLFAFRRRVRGLGPGQEVLQAGKKNVEITRIEPVYMSREECLSIITSIKNAMKGKSKAKILEEIAIQLYVDFGKPDQKTVEQLFYTIN